VCSNPYNRGREAGNKKFTEVGEKNKKSLFLDKESPPLEKTTMRVTANTPRKGFSALTVEKGSRERTCNARVDRKRPGCSVGASNGKSSKDAQKQGHLSPRAETPELPYCSHLDVALEYLEKKQDIRKVRERREGEENSGARRELGGARGGKRSELPKHQQIRGVALDRDE